MKVTDHVEQLLRQGKKPKELVELGFPKRVVTRVRRQLKKEKLSSKTRTPKVRVETQSGIKPPPTSSGETALLHPRMVSLERRLQQVEGRLDGLTAFIESVKEIEARLDGTPGLGLKKQFECECGASGLVALHIECTKCGKETWWGWFPKQ